MRGGQHFERPTIFGYVAEEVAGVAAVHDGEHIRMHVVEKSPFGLVPIYFRAVVLVATEQGVSWTIRCASQLRNWANLRGKFKHLGISMIFTVSGIVDDQEVVLMIFFKYLSMDFRVELKLGSRFF